jgi:hypothetical protein
LHRVIYRGIGDIQHAEVMLCTRQAREHKIRLSNDTRFPIMYRRCTRSLINLMSGWSPPDTI